MILKFINSLLKFIHLALVKLPTKTTTTAASTASASSTSTEGTEK